MRNDRQAYQALAKQVSLASKVDRIMNLSAPYGFRLAAVLATDNRPGKVW